MTEIVALWLCSSEQGIRCRAKSLLSRGEPHRTRASGEPSGAALAAPGIPWATRFRPFVFFVYLVVTPVRLRPEPLQYLWLTNFGCGAAAPADVSAGGEQRDSLDRVIALQHRLRYRTSPLAPPPSRFRSRRSDCTSRRYRPPPTPNASLRSAAMSLRLQGNGDARTRRRFRYPHALTTHAACT